MRSRAILWVLSAALAGSLAAQTPYQEALPGYRYVFPRDYFNHPEYQTEWWYYTGNLSASDGHRFGFELTFFREGVSRNPQRAGTWDVQDLYLAHLAVSDLDGKAFYHAERTNRAGPGIAGIDEEQGRIWNGNWSVALHGDQQTLEGVEERFAFTLKLEAEKPPVIHGENSVSQKAEGRGRASHYISLTRLRVGGQMQVGQKSYVVIGLAWMDHEFFTHQLEKDQVGWDWFSVQLGDNTELMLYRIRRTDGSVDPFSAGTYVDANGHPVHLRREDFSLTPAGESWKSPTTGATYPVRWEISVPKMGIALEATAALEAQELAGHSEAIPNYWEGAIALQGRRGRVDVSGVGYLEMTGYDKAVELGSGGTFSEDQVSQERSETHAQNPSLGQIGEADRLSRRSVEEKKR